MPRSAPASLRRMLVLAAMTALACGESHAIEMFTYFGDGSRIGLPSLEVPIEAYPGIPLRRDRLRARRRAMTPGQAGQRGVAPAGPSQTITIRTMPPAVAAQAAASPAPAANRGKPTAAQAAKELPMPPVPEDMPVPPSP